SLSNFGAGVAGALFFSSSPRGRGNKWPAPPAGRAAGGERGRDTGEKNADSPFGGQKDRKMRGCFLSCAFFPGWLCIFSFFFCFLPCVPWFCPCQGELPCSSAMQSPCGRWQWSL